MYPPPDPLPLNICDQPVLGLAGALLGCHLWHDGVLLQITEVEAYHARESGCHAHRGRTPRTAVMFGPAGHAYVYLCYGLHTMLNVVAEAEGVAAAVLIRGAVVRAGAEQVAARRGGRLDLSGPGKVGQALGLDPTWSGSRLDGPLRLCAGSPPEGATLRRGPRVGIDYAAPADQALPWRLWFEGPGLPRVAGGGRRPLSEPSSAA